jgi:hypothetical protein
VKRITFLGFVLLAMSLSQSASGQSKYFYTEKPKHFYTDKWWWVGRAVSAVAVGVDAWSTGSYLAACPACGDQFPFFDVHSKGSIAGAATISFAISTGFSALEWRFGPKIASGKSGYRIAGYIMQPVTDGIAHGWAANHNWQFVAQCRKVQLSCQ